MNKEDNTKRGEPHYTPPTISKLLGILLKNRRPTGPFNEVWPGVFIGDAHTAQDKAVLLSLGVTHIVNAAAGPPHIDIGPGFYTDTCIQYHGVEAPAEILTSALTSIQQQSSFTMDFHKGAKYLCTVPEGSVVRLHWSSPTL